jgi:hypothetical protein
MSSMDPPSAVALQERAAAPRAEGPVSATVPYPIAPMDTRPNEAVNAQRPPEQSVQEQHPPEIHAHSPQQTTPEPPMPVRPEFNLRKLSKVAYGMSMGVGSLGQILFLGGIFGG